MLKSLIEQGSALIVAKEKIAGNGEYSLSGERYREIEAHKTLKVADDGVEGYL